MKKFSWKILLIPSIGIAFIIAAISSYIFAGKIVKHNIEENIVLRMNSSAYKFWVNPPADILRKYYIFDVKNPSEIKKGIAKPILVQRGPYVYREIWEKRNIEFLGEEFVSFYPVTTLHFEPTLSVGPESDTVTFLNIPAVAAIEQASRSKITGLINFMLNTLNIQLFVTKTVGQLISGYEDPLMKLAKIVMPSVVKDDKFSLTKGENGTSWENFTIMTGADDVLNVGRIVSWNGVEKLNFWGSEYANFINGTDGSFYPPYRTRDQTLYSFNSDMCRSYHVVYLQDNTFHNVKVYDYHLAPDIFANSTVNPNNEGFCENNNCLGNGVLNISKCYGGISGFISQPHFLNADEKFIDALEGMQPHPNNHDFILHFEPTTGVPIGGNIRLQINFYMPQSDSIDLVKNVKPALFPVFWFDDTLKLYDDTIKELGKVALIVKIVNDGVIVMISIGTFLLFVGAIILLYQYSQKRKIPEPINSQRKDFNENSTLLPQAV